ncbi:MAG: ThiF family adenylyltransferase [Mycoplasmatales bacterium]
MDKRIVSEALYTELIVFLEKEKLITSNFKNKYIGTIHESTFFYIDNLVPFGVDPNKILQKKHSKTILILGAGGIETVVLENLKKLGFKIIILDYDIVDITNLNRQLYYEIEDVGKKKIEVLKNKFNDIITLDKKIKCQQCLVEIYMEINFDMIVSCIDTPHYIEEEINRFSLDYNIPNITCGVGIEQGFYGPIIFSEKNQSSAFTKTMKGSNTTSNMIIGSLVSHEVFLYYVCGEKRNRKIIDFNKGVFKNE